MPHEIRRRCVCLVVLCLDRCAAQKEDVGTAAAAADVDL